jgi:hypothetical protein
MSSVPPVECIVSQDMWTWLKTFVTVKNEFYNNKFAPCPYALAAILDEQVDVKVYVTGSVRAYIRDMSFQLRDTPKLSTRVIAFPPRIQWEWGISEYVETLNAELIGDGVFLNTGITKTMNSRYPGSASNDPYFIVVANRLDAVLSGSKALQRTAYYKNWPRAQYDLVVERRDRMAKRYSKQKMETP